MGRRDAHALGFVSLLLLTWGLIVLGALVRAHGAGLACPDWPLCFGQLVPEMDLRVAFEWTHRVTAGSVALIFAGLGVTTWRMRGTPALTRRLLLAAAALLAVQVLLGALTVWRLLAPWTVTAHLVTGNAFAATLLLVATSLRNAPGATAAPVAAGPRRLIALAALLLVVQVVLGGLVASRYAGLACSDWPACNDGVWFPTWRGSVGLHLLHRVNGYALVLALLATAAACRREPHLRRATFLLAGLALLQVGVGVANVLLALPVEATGLHSALATALVLSLTYAGQEAWRRRAC